MSLDPLKFPTPPGVSVAGSRGDAAPDSLLARLRNTAREKREAQTLTVPITGRWEGMLRVRYGMLSLDEIDRLTEQQSNITATLALLARACQAIEAYDPDDDTWLVLEDDLGPVTFDDRLTRLLQWPREADELRYSSREVYEGMFDGNGVAISQHVQQVATWMGVVEQESMPGEASPNTTSSASLPRSDSTRPRSSAPTASSPSSSRTPPSVPPPTGNNLTGVSRG